MIVKTNSQEWNLVLKTTRRLIRQLAGGMGGGEHKGFLKDGLLAKNNREIWLNRQPSRCFRRARVASPGM